MRHVAYKTCAQGRLARKNSPSTAPSAALPRKNSPSTAPPLALPRKSSPSKRKNADFGVFRACRANFFALTPTIRPRRANFFAHKAQQRGDVETNNTTARPQQGSLETGITSAPEKCTKNTHFSPAKAMTVSIEARPAPAKATTVSGNRTPGRQGQAAVPVGDGGDWPGDQWAANVTNASNQRDSNHLARTPVTNVVNLSPKTTIISEKALRLTTFVTTDQKSTRKTPWIDDVCNNTHQSTPKTQHASPPVTPPGSRGTRLRYP